MLAAARPKIKEKDITGLKFFKQLGPLLERLHDNGCQRDLLSVLQAYAGLSSSAQPQPKRHRNPDVLGDHRVHAESRCGQAASRLCELTK